ncbi:MAG: peptidase T [Lachnospiraceae bacterium]|nr:peptidase T [Lachnospiraceae bacterium]
MDLKTRFLNYISVHTTSKEDMDCIPSSEIQFNLAHILEKELNELKLDKVTCDGNCYVYALLPATPGYENKKAVGFIAHMDTAPDYPGENVNPQIIENYNGEDVVLPKTGAVLKVANFPHLKSLKGRTLITTDGSTLLGADDKAGIATIITAVDELIKEGTPHGDIWIGFTPDEEVGCGADKFNLDYFKADYAYTIDGDYEGEVAYENFNASAATVKFTGVNVHPGEAKDIMVNAAAIACEFNSLLPQAMTPEHTEGHEGFIHLTDMEGCVEKATLYYIVRDHNFNLFNKKAELLRKTADLINEKYGEGVCEVTIKESYRNMLEIIEKNEYVVDLARDAIKSVGLNPISRPVRGGTDGARLSFMGLPCPNLGAGGYGFHGPYEHITVEGMKTSVKIIKYLMTHTEK